MTSDLTLFFNVKMLPKLVYVNLPNSNRALVFQSGSVTILPCFTLNHVLFVPYFYYNLLSAHKLCWQFNSILMFYIPGATLQAPSMKRTVILGKVGKGLYLLESKSSSPLKPNATSSRLGTPFISNICNQSGSEHVSNSTLFLASTSVDVKVLHNRLGHMPFSIMKNVYFIPICFASL